MANRQVSYSRVASDECLFSRESEANLGQLLANHKQTFISLIVRPDLPTVLLCETDIPTGKV